MICCNKPMKPSQCGRDFEGNKVAPGTPWCSECGRYGAVDKAASTAKPGLAFYQNGKRISELHNVRVLLSDGSAIPIATHRISVAIKADDKIGPAWAIQTNPITCNELRGLLCATITSRFSKRAINDETVRDINESLRSRIVDLEELEAIPRGVFKARYECNDIVVTMCEGDQE